MSQEVAAAAPPSSRVSLLARECALVLGGSLLVAACARLTVPLPFSPVPVTGQSFGVLVVGLLLGARRGSLALLAYLLEGMAGLPVFAGGGGATYLLGPTGGYLLAFIPAAALAGWAGPRGLYTNWGSTVLSLTAATALIFAGGLPWLAAHQIPNVLAVGFWPYLPGAAVKLGLAAGVARATCVRLHGKGPQTPSELRASAVSQKSVG